VEAAGGEETLMLPFIWFAAAIFAFASLYGWLFFFLVGEAHGAGAEIGMICGVIAVAIGTYARRLQRKEDQAFKRNL